MALPLMEGSSDCSTSIFRFLPFYPYANTETLHIITKTHIQTRKLHAVSVFISYSPYFNSIFRQANTLFRKSHQYPTPFYLSAIYYHGTPGLLHSVKVYFCLIVRFFPLSPSFQRR